jgi:hypothetical protein
MLAGRAEDIKKTPGFNDQASAYFANIELCITKQPREYKSVIHSTVVYCNSAAATRDNAIL